MCWVWANPRNGGYMTHLVVICIPLLDLLPAPQTASQVSLCCTKWWWQSYAENRRPICSNPHYTDYIWIWIKNDQKIKNLELFDFYFHCCSSPKHLVFYDGLHACRCRCRWSLCTAKGAIPCAASGRVPWMVFLSGTVPMDPQLLQVIQSCETIWGCIKTNLAIFGGMNIHLPVIWGSLGYQGFDSYPFMKQICPRKNRL